MPPLGRRPDRLPSAQPVRRAGYDPYSAASYYGAGYAYYSSAAAYGGAAGAAAKAAADNVPLPPPPAKALAALAAAQAAKAAKEGEEGEDAENKKEEVRQACCSALLLQSASNSWGACGGQLACVAQAFPAHRPCSPYSLPPNTLPLLTLVFPLLWPLQERRNAVLVPLLKGAKLAVAGPGKVSPANPKPLGAEAAADPKPDAPAAAAAAPAAKPAAPPAKTAAPPASAPAPSAAAPAPTKAGPKALYLPPSIR